MPDFLPEPSLLIAALSVGLIAGIVKGVVGFALPVVLVSGIGAFLAPEMAIASIVVPGLITNVWQGLRQGSTAAVQSVWKYRLLIGVALATIASTAQLVPGLPKDILFGALGLPIMVISLIQILGWRPVLSQANKLGAIAVGLISGLFGGLAGVFGPPFVMYLTAVNTPKEEQSRILGLVFAMGLCVFTLAHLVSGVVRLETMLFSGVVTIPVLIGTALGFRIQDRVNQATFQKLTLFVLLFAGVNLLRRALLG